MTGTTGQAGEADLWIPSPSEEEPTVSGIDIRAIEATKVTGGWRIAVTVDGEYVIEVNPDGMPRRSQSN